MSKTVVLMLLTLLLLSISVMVGYVFAQSIPKPFIPEFAVDQTEQALKIKNQPFTPYYDAIHGMTINFYYNFEVKSNYSEEWTYIYTPSNGYPIQDPESEYTIISLSSGNSPYVIDTGSRRVSLKNLGPKIDFQVEAMIGYVHREYNPNSTSHLDLYPWVFTGETSGWSEIQTITIPESPISSPEPTPTPYDEHSNMRPYPWVEVILGIAITVAVISAGLVLLLYKIKRK